MASKFRKRIGQSPYILRSVLAQILKAAPSGSMQNILPRKYAISHLGDRLPKLAPLLKSRSDAEFYKRVVSSNQYPESMVLSSHEPDTFIHNAQTYIDDIGFERAVMLVDKMTYLPDDILTKVDRASMAVSLESRVPLLDHDLVEFAAHLPLGLKYRDGQSKWILRQVLYKYIPQALMDRPKKGFSVPIENWLKGPLKEWADDLLTQKKLEEQGYFDARIIRKMWEEHISGTRRWHSQLWNILMFQAWWENWRRL